MQLISVPSTRLVALTCGLARNYLRVSRQLSETYQAIGNSAYLGKPSPPDQRPTLPTGYSGDIIVQCYKKEVRDSLFPLGTQSIQGIFHLLQRRILYPSVHQTLPPQQIAKKLAQGSEEDHHQWAASIDGDDGLQNDLRNGLLETAQKVALNYGVILCLIGGTRMPYEGEYVSLSEWFSRVLSLQNVHDTLKEGPGEMILRGDFPDKPVPPDSWDWIGEALVMGIGHYHDLGRTNLVGELLSTLGYWKVVRGYQTEACRYHAQAAQKFQKIDQHERLIYALEDWAASLRRCGRRREAAFVNVFAAGWAAQKLLDQAQALEVRQHNFLEAVDSFMASDCIEMALCVWRMADREPGLWKRLHHWAKEFLKQGDDKIVAGKASEATNYYQKAKTLFDGLREEGWAQLATIRLLGTRFSVHLSRQPTVDRRREVIKAVEDKAGPGAFLEAGIILDHYDTVELLIEALLYRAGEKTGISDDRLRLMKICPLIDRKPPERQLEEQAALLIMLIKCGLNHPTAQELCKQIGNIDRRH